MVAARTSSTREGRVHEDDPDPSLQALVRQKSLKEEVW